MFYGRGVLNSPWGMLKTCLKFDYGECCKKHTVLIVGNFGNGKINIFDIDNGSYISSLKDCYGNTISIDSLWGLVLNNDGKSIIFTAGIDDENHGLTGFLKNQKC